MSRIGKKPIALPKGVTVQVDGGRIQVKGPKGELSLDLVDRVSAKVEDGSLVFERDSEHRVAKSNHGLMRALASNMVKGVTEGFKKDLLVQGIGYRAEVRGKTLVLNLGYSHQVEFEIPSDVKIEVGKDNTISVLGIDKSRVGQVAANIRAFRKPDRYKGKGVRYAGEHVALKAGKSA